MTDEPLTILIADDEPGVVELYGVWVQGEYEVRTASSGPEALELLDETVDIAFLDRRMPTVDGEEITAEIRERKIGCAVVLMTGVEPDFGLVDVDFDAYLTKPVRRDEFEATVETLRDRPVDDEQHRRYHALVAKRKLLDRETTRVERRESDAYQRLVDQIRAAGRAVDDGAVAHQTPPDG
jgi:CheY-like chemotaxis protein